MFAKLSQRHMRKILQDKPNAFVVSLGDLGESLKCDVTPLQIHSLLAKVLEFDGICID